MGINERLQRPPTAGRPTADDVADPLGPFREQVRGALGGRLGTRTADTELDAGRLAALVASEVTDLVRSSAAPLTAEEQGRLVHDVVDDVLRLGPVQRFVDDPTVTEVMVNGLGPIYVERSGRLERTAARFADEDHLRSVIDRIVVGVGRRVDESSPAVDARLPDGSRVHAILPPLAVDGPTLTIRKFARDALGVTDLVASGTLDAAVADFLAAAVRGRRNIVVAGGTGTGKTTLLNVLSSFVPAGERVITIEDAVELQLRQPHVVRLECRPANVEGRGEVTTRDLVRNALRMRPDRIVVGEVRGAEALDMLQAMNTGHSGSMTTVHANSPRASLARIETMVAFAGVDLPLRAVRQQAAAAFDLVVQLERGADGVRRVTAVTEVVGLEGDVVTLADLFVLDRLDGAPRLRPTGVRPRFARELTTLGIDLPAELFGGSDRTEVR